MGIKKISLFVLAILIITGLNAASLYAADVNSKTVAEAAANNIEEFRAAINGAMIDAKDVVKVKLAKYDAAAYEIKGTTDKILDDNAGLFYVKDCTSSWVQDKDKSSGILTVNINYLYPKDKIIQMKNELNAKIDSTIGKVVSQDMDSNAKELMLHDYLVMNASFTDELLSLNKVPAELSTAYSVLVKGTGDSRGYAKAMKLLLNKVGIECMIVKSTYHAWNIVKIDGNYYHLDSSRDKMKNDQGKEVLTHDYFNVTDVEMDRYHVWDKSKYPACTSNECNYFYKNKTIVNTPDEFKVQIRSAIEGVKESIGIRVTRFDKTLYNVTEVINTVTNENVLLDDITEWYWVENSTLGTVNVIFNYSYPRAEVLLKRQETDKKADEIIKSINPTLKEYNKALILHDYIINNARYDYENAEKKTIPPEEHDAYGVLVKGVGGVDSYVEAMKLLLDKAGVESIIIDGKLINKPEDTTDDSSYAWNMVKFDGNYYHVDLNWDDERVDGKERLAHYFFGVNDEDMKSTHIWDQAKYPSSTNTEYNYFYRNKLVANGYNDAKNKMKEAMRSRKGNLIIKVTGFDKAKFDIGDMLDDAFHRSGLTRYSASWVLYERLGIISIEFDY